MSAQETVKRKLTAVLHADVKGYSRLMSADEALTVRTLTAYRQELYRLTGQYGGRVVDTAGDGFLLEFASVVDAANCAVDLQKTFREKNLELPEDRRLEFRIGINIGDVIEQDGSLFGSGVNIAARLEGLADPGGICVSGEAYDQLKGKVDVNFAAMGSHTVKNIPEPVRVYKVLPEGSPISASPVNKGRSFRHVAIIIVGIIIAAISVIFVMRFHGDALKPTAIVEPAVRPVAEGGPEQVPQSSIAVLPFVNMSGDAEQDYLGDGITEEIITSLAKIPDLFVIARNSTFIYKGRPVNIPEVGKALGVRYVLEGSVKKSQDRIRITAQLIDSKTGGHVWAERYDTDFRNVFDLEDDITKKITSALQVKLAVKTSESIEADRKLEIDPDVFERVMKASQVMASEGRESNKRARKIFEDALESNPKSSRALAGLARTYLSDIQSGWSSSRKDDLEKAERYATQALELNPTSDTAQLILSRVYVVKRDYDKAMETALATLAVNPNNADALAFMGRILAFTGKPSEGIESIKKAIRLNPMAPSWYYDSSGLAYIGIEKYNEALADFTKAKELNQRDIFANIGLIASLSLTGQTTKARNALDDFLISHPKFSVDEISRRLPYKNREDLNRIMGALKSAGLPEGGSGKTPVSNPIEG